MGRNARGGGRATDQDMANAGSPPSGRMPDWDWESLYGLISDGGGGRKTDQDDEDIARFKAVMEQIGPGIIEQLEPGPEYKTLPWDGSEPEYKALPHDGSPPEYKNMGSGYDVPLSPSNLAKKPGSV